MIIVVRNDKYARYAHEIHGVKIKEEKPVYKIVATLQNEGLCIYESADFGEVARTFDIIVEAILNGDHHVFIHPPVSERKVTREEFDGNGIHDFCRYAEDDPERPLDLDMFGRPLPKEPKPNIDTHDFSDPPENIEDFYAWQKYDEHRQRTYNNPIGENNHVHPYNKYREEIL